MILNKFGKPGIQIQWNTYLARANKCDCYHKDGKGVQQGIWFNLEVANIPFLSTMLDPFSNDFKNAKAIVEEVVILSVMAMGINDRIVTL